MLYSRFGINYNDLPAMFRKGSTLIWETEEAAVIEAEEVSFFFLFLSYA